MPCPDPQGYTSSNAAFAARRRPWDRSRSGRRFRCEEKSVAVPSRADRRHWEIYRNYFSPECAGAAAPKIRRNPSASLLLPPAEETPPRRTPQTLPTTIDRGRTPSLPRGPTIGGQLREVLPPAQSQ